MLVTVRSPSSPGPEFFERLSEVTGLVAYDLRNRLRAGSWGVLRAIAGQEEAVAVAALLRKRGIDAVAVPLDVAHDNSRKIAEVRSVALQPDTLEIQLRKRTIPVPYGALLMLVRGEVRLGERGSGRAAGARVSSGRWSSVVAGTEDARVFRETVRSEIDAYAALDVHFSTVTWVARVDVRHSDLSRYGKTGSPDALDRLAELLATSAGIRIDRGQRLSNILSHVEHPASRSSLPPPSSSRPTGAVAPARGQSPSSAGFRVREEAVDTRFDGYSRLVAAAERLLSEAKQ